MRLGAAKFAVNEFAKLKQELEPLIASMGFSALQVMVHQRGKSEELVWACHEIGIHDSAEAFYGLFREDRRGKEKEVKVYLDIESIDYIEFEVYRGGEEGEEEDPA